MSLPTASALVGLDYSFGAQPFCDVPAKAGIDLSTMDYANGAQPFFGPITPTIGGGTGTQFYVIAA